MRETKDIMEKALLVFQIVSSQKCVKFASVQIDFLPTVLKVIKQRFYVGANKTPFMEHYSG